MTPKKPHRPLFAGSEGLTRASTPRRLSHRLAAVIGLSAMLPLGLSGQIVAGWDTFDDAVNPTVSVVGTGVTATASASGTGGDWTNLDSDGRGSSIDGTWGTFNLGVPASMVTTGSANLTLTNGKTDGQITFTIVNDGLDAVDLELEAFRFDAVAFRPNAARAYELVVLPGSSITEGVVFTSADDEITHLGSGLLTNDSDAGVHDQHDDIDIDLTGLADSTLEVGGTAIIQLVFSSGTGSGGGHHLFLDNIALTTASSLTDMLAVTSVPVSVAAGTDFDVTVQAQDASGSPINVTQDTEFTLTSSGIGTLTPATGTILAGNDSVTLNNVQSPFAETITLSVLRTAGDEILPSNPSAPIDIVAGPATQLVVETAVDGSGIALPVTYILRGGGFDVFANSRDALGNFVANESAATFSLVNISGGILATDLTDNLDGSASFSGFELGTANIRATLAGFPDADSSLINVEEVTARWDRGAGIGNGSWSVPVNWSHDTLPAFDNQTDIILYDPVADDSGLVNTYISAPRTMRSLNYTADADANFNIRTTASGTTGAVDLTFDTDSTVDPAEIVIDADAAGSFRIGNVALAATREHGNVVLADNLLVTHNGAGVLDIDAKIVESGGSYGITKEGTGTLTLSARNGDNSYTGDTVVNEGVLRVNGASLSNAGTLVVAGGVVDVEADERVAGLIIGGVAQPDGEYGSTDSGVANPDDVNFSGFGKITVEPAPAAGDIDITSIERTSASEVTITFTAPGNVDIYGSAIDNGFDWLIYATNQPPGTYVDTLATSLQGYYIMVPTGEPGPIPVP